MKRIVKVYDFHDGEEWVAAYSARGALKFYLSETGVDFKYDLDSEMPIEVCDSEMERLKFIEEDEDEESAHKSFKQKLAEMIKAKEKFPCWFALSDY